MKTAVFSTKRYDREFLTAANGGEHEPHFFKTTGRGQNQLAAK